MDCYPLPFTNEVINIVVGHEVYTFLDGFYESPNFNCTKRPVQIHICDKLGGFCLRCKAIWCKKWTPTYQKVVTKTFYEYIDVFMKIFLDDFIIFNDLSTHLEKLIKCLFKSKELGISLNPYKCAFMVFSRTILGFIMSKEGKVMDPKKAKALY